MDWFIFFCRPGSNNKKMWMGNAGHAGAPAHCGAPPADKTAFKQREKRFGTLAPA